eukprot:TRINITY_DN1596_c0_g1_i2.p2 TRINITY_DN1596_c0_g1~~TRINITY_DN1596_c0_g1_i2.p2  ORF type:complete len:321 (+),score=98.11 TRINITY_DN1596_c0_g1_i2:324-1286(+)
MSGKTPLHILVSGATGLLGRPVVSECVSSHASDWRVTGTSFTRAAASDPRVHYERVDLLRLVDLPAFLDRLAPIDVLIHTAGERRPDVSELDPVRTQRLNVGATTVGAKWAAEHGAFFVYISSDYVFDGTTPPYKVGDPTNPLNTYGRSKRDAENAVREACPNSHVILRVPILYGDVETLDESPITTIATEMRRAGPGQRVTVDNWATRYPTHTADVALVVRQLIERRLAQPGFCGTFHWSSEEAMTKFDMARQMAPLLNFNPSLLTPDDKPPTGATRPKDPHLDSKALEMMCIGRRTPFASGIKSVLTPHLHKPRKSEL